jgi:uncharacterized metal-binding protein
MVDLPKKKVGIIACSGEEIPEGTLTRLAALKVLEQLRPGDTVTICLPLFLAGGEGDRAFAKFYPTISVDGCELLCAARATEKYSNKPAASFMVRDLIKENNLDQPIGRRCLNPAGMQAVRITAERISQKVDELVEKERNRKLGQLIQLEPAEVPPTEKDTEPEITPCACGSGIPVQKVIIHGREVQIVGLPLIFQQFFKAGKNPNDATLNELMATIKIYNPIPAEVERAYSEAIEKAYMDYWYKGKDQ